MRALPIALCLAICLFFAPIHLAAQVQLQVAAATASSEMKDPKTPYGAAQAVDGKLNTWWTPAPPNSSGSNSWLRLTLAQPCVVTGIYILGGSHYPNYPGYGDIFKMNHRLRQAKVEFSDGSSEDIVLKDIDELQTISFKQKHSSEWLRIIPKAVYNGSKWADLCISEVQPIGYRPSEKDKENNANAWRDYLDDVVGVWLMNPPCTNMRYIIGTSDENKVVLTEAHIFDAMQYEIVGIEKKADGYTIAYRSTTDETKHLNLGANTFFAGNYQGSDAEMALTIADEFLVGQYKTENGDAVEISRTHISRAGRSFAYTYEPPPSMYGSCGTIDLGDGPLQIRFKGRDIALHKITLSNDGPDYSVDEQPYRVYYRVK